MAGLPVPFWIERQVAVFGALGEPERAFVETLRGLGAHVHLDPAGVPEESLEVAFVVLGRPEAEDMELVASSVLDPIQAWFPLLRGAFVVVWAPIGATHAVVEEADAGLVSLFERHALHGVGLRLPPQHGPAEAGLDPEDLQAALLASVEGFDRLTRVRYDLSDPESVAAFSADTGWERVWDALQTDQRYRARG